MITNKEPSRKELAEISSMVLIGADCLMLCQETSIGQNPILSISALGKAIAEAESIYDYD